MLDALERSMSALDASVHAQRQLVADASHELRTPVTSLRTNIEILQQAEDMDSGDRARLLNDVVEQIEELTLLMNDLIDLARGEEPRADAEDMRLDLVVGEVVDRARKHAPVHPVARAARADGRRRGARAAAAGHQQPDRQRRQVQPSGRAGGDRAARAGADGARPRTRDRRRGSAARVRPLLPRRRGPRPSRLGAGARDRAPGGRPAGRERPRRAGRRRRNADAAAPARRRAVQGRTRRAATRWPAGTHYSPV